MSSLCVRPVHRFQITGSPKREDYRSVFAIYRCPTCLFRRSQSRGHPCASPRAARTGDRAYRFWAGFPSPHPGVTPIQCPGKSLAGTGFDRIRWLGIDTFEVRGVMRRPGRLSQERSRPPTLRRPGWRTNIMPPAPRYIQARLPGQVKGDGFRVSYQMSNYPTLEGGACERPSETKE